MFHPRDCTPRENAEKADLSGRGTVNAKHPDAPRVSLIYAAVWIWRYGPFCPDNDRGSTIESDPEESRAHIRQGTSNASCTRNAGPNGREPRPFLRPF